jgi:hypothetical protein
MFLFKEARESLGVAANGINAERCHPGAKIRRLHRGSHFLR